MSPPDVSIVIVSFNTKELLARCLSSVPAAIGPRTYEIIVVDNGSADGTQALMAKDFPELPFIQNSENVGFGRANNIGVEVSRASLVLFLNSDCELGPGALSMMVEVLEKDSCIGVLSCRLLNPDGSLQPSVHRSCPSPWMSLGDLFGISSLRFALYRRPALHPWLLRTTIRLHRQARDVAWCGGACALVRRKAFEAVNGFDEAFFMYYEDIDLCKRIGEAGYRLRYLPEPFAIHHWGKSASREPSRMLYEGYRSRILYFEKHFPGWGGRMARSAALSELWVRQRLLSIGALLPSRHLPRWRDRVLSTKSCREALHGDFPGIEAGSRALSADSGVFLLLFVVLFGLLHYAHDIVAFALQAPFIDFAHYYTYATMVSQGLDPFDPQALAHVDQQLHIRRAGAAANYPPLFYLFMQPWAYLPFRQSSLLWLMVNQLCLVGALALVLRQCAPPSPVKAVAVLFLVLMYQPLRENVALGQVNIIVLFLVTLAWACMRAERTWAAAAATATALFIKLQFGLLIPLLWWMGQGRLAVRAMGLAVLGLGVSLLVLGPAHHLHYAQYIMSIPDYILTWTVNVSPRATLHRLVGPYAGSQVFADFLWLALSIGVLCLFAMAIPRKIPPHAQALDWAWGLGLVAVFLLSPLTSEHHLVLLLLPLTLLILRLPDSSRTGWDMGLLLGSIVALASRYSLDQFPVFHQGWLSLLLAGKLLGVILLACLLVRRIREREAVRS